MSTDAADDLVARLLKPEHWSDCNLYTGDPAQGGECDCGYPLRAEAAARITELDDDNAKLRAVVQAAKEMRAEFDDRETPEDIDRACARITDFDAALAELEKDRK